MKYIHWRLQSGDKVSPKGGVTFAYLEDGNRVFYSIARCSRKDHYNKKLGRKIATGRFDKELGEGKIRSVPIREGKSIPQLIIDHYADEKCT